MSQHLLLATTDLSGRLRIRRPRHQKSIPMAAGQKRRRRRQTTTLASHRVTRTVPDPTLTKPSWITSTGKWPRMPTDLSEIT